MPDEGPLDYARRLASARPFDAAALTSVCTRYARLRYRYHLPLSRAEVDALARTIGTLRFKQETSARPIYSQQ